jgi:pimeloyl-ACP methyl ester carboxylesterase
VKVRGKMRAVHINLRGANMKIRYRVFAINFLIFILVAALSGAQAQTSTPDAITKPTIVIVHGAWGGSWAFRHVEALLREKGFNVYRPQLTGLGERVHLNRPDIGLSTHIDDVVNMILFEDLHDIILMGHSYGGMVITGVADRVPDRIRRLVYVDAFVPNDGESVMSILGSRVDFLKQMTKGDYVVPAWVKPDQPPPHDVPQSLKTFTEPVSLKNKAALKLPATYILTVEAGKEAKDDDFWPQSQRAKQRGWPILQLTADHNAQWSAPEALVEMLARIR